ncbi:hypothetical protein JYK22_35280, partial [Nonomuraea sp. RK-328]|nr:hypothetical protein [Nonomuraea sp. RK-328]
MGPGAIDTATVARESVADRRCFVIMPISTPSRLTATYQADSDHFAHVYDLLFVPAIVAAGFVPVPPAARGSDLIHAGIVKNLQEAEIVMCDVSTLNANVFFELGIRTALNKPVVFVRDSLTADIPFDAAIMHFHIYDAGLRAWELPGEVKKLTRHISEVDERAGGQNQLWKYFGLTEVAEPPPETPVVHPSDSPVERKLDELVQLVQQLRMERSRAGDPRRSPGVLLEEGFDGNRDDSPERRRNLAEFLKIVDETAKRHRTQIVLSRFDDHLIVDFGKDIYTTLDTDKIRMASLLLDGMTVEFTAQV